MGWGSFGGGLCFTIIVVDCFSFSVSGFLEGNFSAIAFDNLSNPSFNLEQRLVAQNYLPPANRAGKLSAVSELISVGTPIESKKPKQQQQQQQTSSLHDMSSDLRRQDEEFLKGLSDLLKGLVRAKL